MKLSHEIENSARDSSILNIPCVDEFLQKLKLALLKM